MDKINHLLPFLLLIIPIIWGLVGYFKVLSKSTRGIEHAGYKWPLIINSAVLYALAFNLIFFIQELFLALGKKWLGLKAYLYHNNHNWEGSHPMDQLAQGYGAFAIFILGILCLIIARVNKSSVHWVQLFILWLAFQGFAQSIPQFITAVIAPDTDTGQAFTYLGLNKTAGLLISLFGIILMLWISVAYSKLLLQLAPSKEYLVKTLLRSSYLFQVSVVASIIGVLLIIPFRIMPWSRAIAPVIVTLVSVPMIFANAWNIKLDQSTNNSVNQKIFITPIILLAILLLIFQLILAKGVEV